MSDATCSVDRCEKPANASRGWCWAHYQRWRKHGDTRADVPVTLKIGGPTELRMEARTDRSGGPDKCWLWTGHFDSCGYGRVKHEGRDIGAHRASYLLNVGPIPGGMVVCHRCDNPPCVNPAHLWLGTQADNIADMDAKGRRVAAESLVTHCPRGHPYDEANTHFTVNGSRQCRRCGAERAREKRARDRDPNFDRSVHGKYAMHLRWHERRGVVKLECSFCVDPDADGIYACP